MLQTTLNKRLSELVITWITNRSVGEGGPYLKGYINLSKDEIIKKIDSISWANFVRLARDLGPFYESQLDERVWELLLSSADVVTFENTWLKLSPQQRSRLQRIAPIYFLKQEFRVHTIRIKLLAPELAESMKDSKGPSIDKLNAEVYANHYKQLTASDLPRLRAKPPEQLTYHEISSISFLVPREWEKIFHTLDYFEQGLPVRKTIKDGSEAMMRDYMLIREIRLMQKFSHVVKAA